MSNPDQLPTGSQVIHTSIIDTLVREYYASVYRLALAALQDSGAAQRAAERTFVAALLHLHRRFPPGDTRLWLYALALKAIHVEGHRLTRKPGIPPAPATPERRLWRTVDDLGSKERMLCVLHYVLCLKNSEAAALLHVGESAVRAQLEIFRSKFREILGDRGAALPEIAGNVPPGELSVEALPSMENRVAESLQKRWPAPLLSPAELEEVINRLKQLAAQERARQQRILPFRRLAIAIGVILLAVLCLFGGLIAWLVSSRSSAGAGQPTAIEGWATRAAPLPKVKPLTRRSDSEVILLRMQESSTLWNTLWIDSQKMAYGPQSYIGPPRMLHAQAWISQPDQSVEVMGLSGRAPSSIYMVLGDRSYYLNPTLAKSTTQKFSDSADSLLSSAWLRDMVYPGESTWAEGEGSVKAVKYEEIAGLHAVVTDWINPQGRREARLWLDAQTSLILRLQEYGGDDSRLLLSDTVVTEIAYNRASPPPSLSEALELKEPQITSEGSGIPPTQHPPTPSPTGAMTDRVPLSPEPAPARFDPTLSRLIFQFPMELSIANSPTATVDIPAELFADGYLLGSVKFGLPWVLRCDRSPDGQRLAFNTGTDGVSPPGDSLRWFNLKDPRAVYQPLPGLHVSSFVFSPDSRRLAVFGSGEGEWESGIYLLEIGTGEHQLLIHLAGAASLVWSPDGEFLALMGSMTEADRQAALVIHINTGQVAYRIEAEFLDDETSTDWPMASWGVEFPVEMGGMDQCAAPP